MRLAWILALVALVALVVWALRGLVARGLRSGRAGRAGGGRASVASLRRTIAKMTHDPLVAERLIESERARHPELGERALLRKVIRRLERDRRR
jgi:hypothetical protein